MANLGSNDSDGEFESVSAAEINNTVHVLGSATKLHDAVVEHGSHTRYVVHDKDSPYVFGSSDLLLPSEMDSHIEIVGKGYPRFELGDDVNDDLIRSANDGSGSTSENVRIEGIIFDGNKANQTLAFGDEPASASGGSQTLKGSVGIRPVDASDWVIEDCEFIDWHRFGYCAKLTQGPMTVRDCDGDNCDDDAFTVSNQFFQTKDPDSASHLFDNVAGANCGDQGLEVEDGAQNVVVRDSEFTNNKQGGAVKSHGDGSTPHEESCNNVTWIRCEFRDNLVGLQFQGSGLDKATDLKAIDCYWEGNDQDAFRFVDPNNISLPIKGAYVGGQVEITTGRSLAVHSRNSTVIDDLEINLDVNVKSASTTVPVINLFDIVLDDVHIDCRIECNGNAPRGIEVNSGNGVKKDVSIAESTRVVGATATGARIRTESGNEITLDKIAGTFKNNGTDTGLGNTNRAGLLLDDNNGTLENGQFVGVRAYDDQGTKTQQVGIYRGGDYHVYTGNNVRGNANASFGGTLGTNSVAGSNIT